MKHLLAYSSSISAVFLTFFIGAMPAFAATSPSWTTVGSAGFVGSDSSNLITEVIASDGTPYIGFQSSNDKASVMKYNGSSWVNVGPSDITTDTAIFDRVAFDHAGTPYIVYDDSNTSYSANVMKYNGSSWAAVGSTVSSGEGDRPQLAFDASNTPYIAYSIPSGGVVVDKFDGTNWNQVGTDAFSGIADGLAFGIDSNNTPYVAYVDQSAGEKIGVVYFNGSSWVQAGSGYVSTGWTYDLNMAISPDNHVYVTYRDIDAGNKVTVMKYSGGVWSAVGGVGITSAGSYGPSLAFGSDSTPYVSFQDNAQSHEVSVLKYTGSSWVSVGSPGFAGEVASASAITIDQVSGIRYVAYVANSTRTISVFKYVDIVPDSVSASSTPDGGVITWTTTDPASTQVAFGITSTPASTTSQIDTGTRVQSHTVTLHGLSSCSTYHYQVSGSAASGGQATSTDQTFTTGGCTGAASVVSTQSASINTTSGGSVTNGAITVQAPSGFTTATTTPVLDASKIDSTAFYAVAGTPSGRQAIGTDVFTLKVLADATTTISSFDAPITITMSYDPAVLSSLPASSLWIYRYDSGVWTSLDDCTVNTGADTVSCQTSHFSDFALFGTVPSSVAAIAPRTSGTSVTAQVQNLLAMGNTARAAQIETEWPQLFGHATSTTSAPVSASFKFTRDLMSGMTGEDVQALQQFLNTHGFVITKTGAGSPGHETTRFGALTKKALASYQAVNGISPALGYFGPLTRSYINAHP